MAVITGGLRFIVGAVFLLSGALKVLDPGRFLIDVLAFEAVPYPVAYLTALGLPWLEILCALALWSGIALRGAALWLLLLSMSFIFLLARSAYAGMDLECGCFGDWLVFPHLGYHLAFNALLAAACVWIWAASQPKAGRSPRLRETLQRALLEKE